jgi:hypothetical protein
VASAKTANNKRPNLNSRIDPVNNLRNRDYMSQPRYTIVADPNSLRYEFYMRELDEFWRLRNRTPQIKTVSWSDLIDADGRIEEFDCNPDESCLRIESPARGFGVIRRLLQAGQRATGVTETKWDPMPGLNGWIASPRLIYRGLCHVLNGLQPASKMVQETGWLDSPNCSDVCQVFDKNATSVRLKVNGLPTPNFIELETREAITNQSDFLAEMRARKWRSAFLKLANGSCASGIVFWERDRLMDSSGSKTTHKNRAEMIDQFTTTVTRIGDRFYNTRNVTQLSATECELIVQMILEEGATIQEAVPAARINGLKFDVRVVVLRGEVIATVFRASAHPMANLHLGGIRADANACRKLIPQRKWLDAMDACVEAANLWDVAIMGVDLIFERHTFDPYIIELNAFGDFLPNWKNSNGRSVHSLEIESTAKACGFIC